MYDGVYMCGISAPFSEIPTHKEGVLYVYECIEHIECILHNVQLDALIDGTTLHVEDVVRSFSCTYIVILSSLHTLTHSSNTVTIFLSLLLTTAISDKY